MTRHNNFVLFIALVVYVYRDVWPLATYTERPVDESEGALLWTRLVVLFTTAVIIPLVIPRQYVPVDPKVNTLPVTMITKKPAVLNDVSIAPHEGAEP